VTDQRLGRIGQLTQPSARPQNGEIRIEQNDGIGQLFQNTAGLKQAADRRDVRPQQKNPRELLALQLLQTGSQRLGDNNTAPFLQPINDRTGSVVGLSKNEYSGRL